MLPVFPVAIVLLDACFTMLVMLGAWLVGSRDALDRVRPWGSLLHDDFSQLADLVLTKLTVSGADAHGERGRGLAALVRCDEAVRPCHAHTHPHRLRSPTLKTHILLVLRVPPTII